MAWMVWFFRFALCDIGGVTGVVCSLTGGGLCGVLLGWCGFSGLLCMS